MLVNSENARDVESMTRVSITGAGHHVISPAPPARGVIELWNISRYKTTEGAKVTDVHWIPGRWAPDKTNTTHTSDTRKTATVHRKHPSYQTKFPLHGTLNSDHGNMRVFNLKLIYIRIFKTHMKVQKKKKERK